MSQSGSRPSDSTADNEVIQHLRQHGPATAEELPRPPSARERSYVGSFKVTRSNTGSSKSRGKTNVVYYLYGDERRLVRKYIQENTEFVRSCMQDNANPINMSLEDYWWQMFCEEWLWSGLAEEGEAVA
ncbi:MAG: hypothetical protein ACLFMT_04490 [Halobacteriales archaeon]